LQKEKLIDTSALGLSGTHQQLLIRIPWPEDGLPVLDTKVAEEQYSDVKKCKVIIVSC